MDFPQFFCSSSSEALEIIHIMFELLGVLLNRAISCLHVATIVFSASIVLKPDLDPKTGWLDIHNCTMHMVFIVVALHCSVSSSLVNGRQLSPALQNRTIMKFCFRLSFYLGNCAMLTDLTICWESAFSLPVLLSSVLVHLCSAGFFWHIYADFLNKIFCIYTFVDLF